MYQNQGLGPPKGTRVKERNLGGAVGTVEMQLENPTKEEEGEKCSVKASSYYPTLVSWAQNLSYILSLRQQFLLLSLPYGPGILRFSRAARESLGH